MTGKSPGHGEVSMSKEARGKTGWVQRILSIAILILGFSFILGIETRFGIALFKEQYVGLFLAVCLFLVFMTTRATKKNTSANVPWYDWILAFAGVASGLYLAVKYPELATQLSIITTPNLIFGTVLILLVIEAVRRLEGWPLVGLIVFFILYGRFANYFPGIFNLRSTSFQRLIQYIYLEPNSMLSLAGIAATIAFSFIFFGDLLFGFRGTFFIRDFSLSILGRFRGAPAKVAVVASSLFGMITGGAVTNVMAIGSFTIPMMKTSGYPAYKAASIESVSSSGGQIMPPVMSLAAFLIAEFLHLPYATVALAAVLPAVLYYAAVFIQVDLDSAKIGIRGLKPEEMPNLLKSLKDAWLFVIPMGILVYLLFIRGQDAASAGVMTCIASIIIFAISRENRVDFWKKLMKAIERTMRTMLTVTIVLTGAGFIVAVTNITGLGSVFSMIIVQIAGGNPVALVVTTAIACMILGMGMPTVPAYVLVAILAAPALAGMGFSSLAVHMFVLYFAIVSNFTPPVAMAAYAAAALAKAESMKTSFDAMRLGILAYIVPFLFIFSPALILEGSALEIGIAFLSAILGTLFLGIALSGYLFKSLVWYKRLLSIFICAGFLFPLLSHNGAEWISYIVAVALAVVLFASEWHTRRVKATVEVI